MFRSRTAATDNYRLHGTYALGSASLPDLEGQANVNHVLLAAGQAGLD
jgi:hypothetical protein